MDRNIPKRSIGNSGLRVPPLGFGAFKIGRNQGVKYPNPYDLPDEIAVGHLLNSVLDLGCTLIDTAPAYGLSEVRIGDLIGHRRDEFVLSTKVGETFIDGKSNFDFSSAGVTSSLERSLRNLRTDVLDIVFIHSNGDDRHILENTDGYKASDCEITLWKEGKIKLFLSAISPLAMTGILKRLLI